MANEGSPSSDIRIHIMNEKLHIYMFISDFVIYFIVLSVWNNIIIITLEDVSKIQDFLLGFQLNLVSLCL